MVEVRQHADGRTALRLPEPLDDVAKGECAWMAFSFGGEPQHHLNVELLTDDEVRDWTPLGPMPCGVASCPDYVSEVWTRSN